MSTDVQGLEPMVGNAAESGNNAGKDSERVEIRRVECFLTESLFKRILRKLFPDQRKNDRHVVPPLVGYLGTVKSSKPYDLSDISLSGFCLLTDERWSPGTEMPISLERTNWQGEGGTEIFTVQATVVRCDKDGVGFSIVLSEDDSYAAYGNPLSVKWVSKREMEEFLARLKEQPELESAKAVQDSHAGSKASERPNTQLATAFEGGR